MQTFPGIWHAIPVDFMLFACTLLGVARFHHHTLKVALVGLAVITSYKLAFTGFKFGPGLPGLGRHMADEAVTLANLFLLLMGFALRRATSRRAACPKKCRASWPTTGRADSCCS